MTSKTLVKVLIREEAKFPVTKSVNSISLARKEKERSNKTFVTPDNTEMPTEIKIPVKEVETNNKAECEPIKMAEEEETTEVPNSQPVEYYLTHNINKKLIEGFVDDHRISKSSCKIEKGVKNDIEPITSIMNVNRLVLEWEERIKLHLNKEMKFNQWRSNNFKSNHPTPIKEEGGIDDEGEVMHLEELHVTGLIWRRNEQDYRPTPTSLKIMFLAAGDGVTDSELDAVTKNADSKRRHKISQHR
ncbi:hypothetical protein Tco_1253310 [Tanacetum coccineum]